MNAELVSVAFVNSALAPDVFANRYNIIIYPLRICLKWPIRRKTPPFILIINIPLHIVCIISITPLSVRFRSVVVPGIGGLCFSIVFSVVPWLGAGRALTGMLFSRAVLGQGHLGLLL